MCVYRCTLMGFANHFGDPLDSFLSTPLDNVRARVLMKEDHDHMGSARGGVTITSAIRTIDFARGYLVTQNNVYDFSGSVFIRCPGCDGPKCVEQCAYPGALSGV